MIARWTLTRQLIDVGVMKQGESADDDKAFESLYRNIWADNCRCRFEVIFRDWSFEN